MKPCTPRQELNARYVIQAVGPRMSEENEDEKLRDATLNSLKLAEKLGLNSIVFSAISAGIFGYPKERCAQVMLGAVKEHVFAGGKIREVVFCLYGYEMYRVFEGSLGSILG